MAKRLLIVAYYYPPVATSGAMRPLAFSRYLDRDLWQPIVLAADPASVDPELGFDAGLAERIPPDVQVIRASHGDPIRAVSRWRGILNTGASGRPLSGTTHARRAESESWSFSRAAGAVMTHIFRFPDLCAPWRRPAVRSVIDRLAEAPPDIVLATAPPWTSLQVGARLAKHFRVPLVADLRDPWTLNHAKYGNQSLAVRRARRGEAAIVAQSALVIANTEASADELIRRYPGAASRIVAIPNGVDLDSMGSAGCEATDVPATLQLCHFGSIYGQRTPLRLLRALQALLTQGVLPAHRDAPLVRFIGGWDPANDAAEALAAALERAGIIRREPGLPHDACLREMRRAPVLLALQPASPLQIPGKLYEYVAAGRPILLIGGEGASRHLMERHSLGLQCGDDDESIVNVLTELLAGQWLPSPDPATATRFDYGTLTAQLSGALASLVNPKQAALGVSDAEGGAQPPRGQFQRVE